jgi:hypothetical protein
MPLPLSSTLSTTPPSARSLRQVMAPPSGT